jgi:hypothetical protein
MPVGRRQNYMKRTGIKPGTKRPRRNYGGIRTTAPRPGSLRELRKRAGSLVAQAAKMRDGHQCRQCLDEGRPSSGVIDAGHLYPKGTFKGTAYSLDNVFGQCRYHNQLHIAQPAYFFDWYLRHHTQEQLDELHARAVGPTPSREQLQTIIAELTVRVEEMRCHQDSLV